MSLLTEKLQRFLRSRRIVCNRLEQEIPPSCGDFLRRLAQGNSAPDFIYCFDNDVHIQEEVLQAFSPDRVDFFTPFTPCSDKIPNPFITPPGNPPRRFLVELDGETYNIEDLAAEAPWILQADIIIIRSTLGSFWSGKGDLCCLDRYLSECGFHISDVIDYVRVGLLKAPLSRIAVVFSRGEHAPQSDGDGPGKRQRVIEALTYLSQPIARTEQLSLLAGRGTFGFSGGVFNPGAVADREATLLLARGESMPWAVQRTDRSVYLSACQPVLLRLKPDLSIAESTKVVWRNLPAEPTRMEDFRLLRFRDQLLANHSVMTMPDRVANRTAPVRLDLLQSRAGISVVNAIEKTISFLGFPKIDRPVSKIEKNWVMFAHSDRLFLIYSFNPFHLLCNTTWPDLKFQTVTNTKIDLPFDDEAHWIRNSINPVVYDDQHFLHVVHQVRRGQNYVFWPILIDKESLRPIKVGARPLARGWNSSSSAIIYLCSAVVHDTHILFFAGLNDSSTGCWQVQRSVLDQQWVPIG